MGAAKEFIEQCIDFLIFVAACAFMISGFANFASIQTVINNSISNKGALVTHYLPEDTGMSGEEVIALLLLPDGIASVEIDGTVFRADLRKGIPYVNVDGTYHCMRESTAEGIKLVFIQY